jgi:hypothetical protein
VWGWPPWQWRLKEDLIAIKKFMMLTAIPMVVRPLPPMPTAVEYKSEIVLKYDIYFCKMNLNLTYF